MMTVWKYGVNKQADRHSGKKIGTAFVKILLRSQKKISYRYKNIYKPQKVGNDKHLVKGNKIIQPAVYVSKFRINRHCVFKKIKPDQIYKKIG
jgi:hypothetical protein